MLYLIHNMVLKSLCQLGTNEKMTLTLAFQRVISNILSNRLLLSKEFALYMFA